MSSVKAYQPLIVAVMRFAKWDIQIVADKCVFVCSKIFLRGDPSTEFWRIHSLDEDIAFCFAEELFVVLKYVTTICINTVFKLLRRFF
jgi:hypothetical protein